MITLKDMILVSVVCITLGFITGYLYKGNSLKANTEVKAKIETNTTIKPAPPLSIEADIDAKVDTVYQYIVVNKDTQSTDSVNIVDIVAKGDTLLKDSSYIAAEYSYAAQRFKFRAELKQNIIENTIKETITNTIEEKGLIYFQAGYGLLITQEKIVPGFFVGIGYSFKIF